VLSRPLGHLYFLAPAPVINPSAPAPFVSPGNVADVIDSPLLQSPPRPPLQVTPASVWSSLPGSPVVTTRKMHQPSIAYRNLA